MTQLHSSRTANHRPYAGVYADAAERLAATGFERALGGGVVPFATEDLYKKALQVDNASEWILTAITPTWAQVGGNGLVPAAHKTSHQLGGGDAIKLDDLAAPDDNTDLNVSTGAHGLTPKLNNSSTSFLNGQGAWATPPGSGDVVGPASATDHAVARYDLTTGKIIQNSVVIISDAGVITVPEIAAPSTPAAGTVHIYAKSDGKLYIKDDAGTETDLTAAGGGGIGGSTGSTDNALLRADGTGGATVQSSALTVEDTTGAIQYPSSTGDKLRLFSNTYGIGIEANTLTIWAQDVFRFRRGGTSVSGGTEVFSVNGATGVGILTVNTVIPVVIDFTDVTGDKILWNGTNFGTGVEAFTLTNWSQTNHRWRIGGTSVASGTEVALLNIDGLAAVSVRGTAVTFANRPATPVEGMLVAFTDSTTVIWGTTITGGGSNHVLGYYNGTNWTVAAI